MAKKDETPEVTEAVTGEPVETDDNPYASGEVSLGALRIGARDNDSVRRLQYALGKKNPGAVTTTGNYQTRTASLVREAVGEGDGNSLTKAQAKKILGSGYTVVD